MTEVFLQWLPLIISIISVVFILITEGPKVVIGFREEEVTQKRKKWRKPFKNR